MSTDTPQTPKPHVHETDHAGRQICTTSGDAPSAVREQQRGEGDYGQHSSYIVLCESERQKGFTRPYRDQYRHVGANICGKNVGHDGDTVCHMSMGHDGDDCGFAKGPRPPMGCGAVTTMGRALSETYARDPSFYSHTFCAACKKHYPVGDFVWEKDGMRVGS